MTTAISAIAILAAAAPALAQFDLARYHVAASYPLPSIVSEASAVAYNHDRGTLFVLGDEGQGVLEVSTAGVPLSVMTLTGFDDTEGLTYIGGDRFVIIEERIQNAYRFTYAPGGSVARGSLPVVDLGPTIGNLGVEGVAYEASSGTYFAVNEKTPQRIRSGTMNFDTPGHTMVDLFAPSLGVLDLADVAVLSTVASLAGTPDAQSLLLFSQESARLLEVSRTGVVLSQFDFSAFAGNAEGVVVSPDGTIYIVGENPTLYVLVPTPGALAVLTLASISAARRRRA